MEIKMFGKSLFSFKSGKAEALWTLSTTANKGSKYLPDFFSIQRASFIDSAVVSRIDALTLVNPKSLDEKSLDKEVKKEEEKTPKEIFKLKMLHDDGFILKTDPEYVDSQLADFKDKLALIKSEEYDMGNGVKEISSIIVRLENRKKYAEHKEVYEEFPYTTTARIQDLIKKHDYLKIGQVAQFLADMPKEATDAMKKYNKATMDLCGKQAVFYIIAKKKDFEKTQSRRDPILLAQSPFGHFWNLIGAWDEEMLLVEEL